MLLNLSLLHVVPNLKRNVKIARIEIWEGGAETAPQERQSRYVASPEGAVTPEVE